MSVPAPPTDAGAAPSGSGLDEFPFSSEGQLNRLTRPGAKYFNLNPFEVLGIDFAATEGEIKKKYRKLARLVHPDKNPTQIDVATTAFDAVNRAFQRLSNPIDVEVARQCAAAAKTQVEEDFRKQREAAAKKEKKEKKAKGKAAGGGGGADLDLPEEGTPEYDRVLRLHTCKVFAEREAQRKESMEREAAELKRKREAEAAYEEALRKKKAEKVEWEKGRDERVEGWRSFADHTLGGARKRPRPGFGVRPPKIRVEERPAGSAPPPQTKGAKGKHGAGAAVDMGGFRMAGAW